MEYQQKKEMILPEYGRNVQQMVEYCKKLEDKDKRNLCARSIISTMSNLMPSLRGTQTLWDHLAMIAGFDLDIDWPTEPIHENRLESKPNHIDYHNPRTLKMRHYGRLVPQMIERACECQDDNERKSLARLAGIRMKMDFVTWNKDEVSDQYILDDMKALSDGKLSYTTADLQLGNVSNVRLQNDLPVKEFSRRRHRRNNNNNNNKKKK